MKIKLTIMLDTADIGEEPINFTMLRKLRDDPADLQRGLRSGAELREWLSQTLVDHVPVDKIRTEHVRGWIAGWNTPGYLPNPDNVHHFDTRREAVQSLMDDLRNALGEHTENQPEWDRYTKAIETLRLIRNDDNGKDAWTQVDQHVFWVRREDA